MYSVRGKLVDIIAFLYVIRYLLLVFDLLVVVCRLFAGYRPLSVTSGIVIRLFFAKKKMFDFLVFDPKYYQKKYLDVQGKDTFPMSYASILSIGQPEGRAAS